MEKIKTKTHMHLVLTSQATYSIRKLFSLLNKNTRSEPRTQDQEKVNQTFRSLLHQHPHSANVTIINKASMDIRRKNPDSYHNP